MGAWGTDSWENDTALDWLEEFETDASSSIEKELRQALSCDELLDTSTCCRGFAAAEAVAASHQMPGPGLPEVVRDWSAAHPGAISKSLLDVAIAVVVRIEAGSELQQLFDENGRNEEWHASVEGLLGRLRSIELP